MKKNFIIFIIIFIGISLITVNGFEPIPIIINFTGIEVKNDTMIAYGDYGSVLMSYDNSKNWIQKRIFDRGTIVKLFIEDDRFSAFNNYGDINLSSDNGKSWNITAKLSDSIVSVIKFPKGYYIRTKSGLILLNSNFNILSEYPINISSRLKTNHNITESIAYFKGNFVVETDSSNYIMFDKNLIPIDTFSIKKTGLCTDCNNHYLLRADSNSLYMSIDDKIIRTDDFKFAQNIYNIKIKVYDYKPLDGKVFIVNGSGIYSLNELINKDSLKVLTVMNCDKVQRKYLAGYIELKDFSYQNERFTIVAGQKFIGTKTLKDSISTIISDIFGVTKYSMDYPDEFSDSSYIFFNNSPIYQTLDNGLTFRSTVDDEKNPLINYFKFALKYYDESEKKLYLFGNYDNSSRSIVLISKDYGSTFDSVYMENFNFLGTISNFCKRGNNYVISHSDFYLKPYNWILTYDNNFKMISMYRDSNFTVSFVNSNDTNSFLIITNIDINNNKYIKYTSNKGLNWDTIKLYSFWTDSVLISGNYVYIYNSNLLWYQEITFNQRNYWALFSFNKLDSIMSFDMMDIEDRIVKSVYKRKLTDSVLAFNDMAVTSNNDSLFLAIADTLYCITDLFDKSKRKNLSLPKGGKINWVLKKFRNKFFAKYSDDKHERNLYWLYPSGIDSSFSVIDGKVEYMPYFYYFPPYPLPAKQIVRCLIYWDNNINLNDNDIIVFDIYGNKVNDSEKINVDRLNAYSGILTWDCSNVAPGVYIIRIKRGTNSITLKVMVSR